MCIRDRLGIEHGTDFARWMYLQIRHNVWWILPCLIFAVIAGLIIGWMSRKESMASGSGIPQVVGYVNRGLNMRWHTILPVRFVGGLLGSLFGLSLGREGPSIQIGACGAQMLSRILRKGRRDDIKEHYVAVSYTHLTLPTTPYV